MHDGPMIEPIRLVAGNTVADMIDIFAGSGFNARRLAEACSLYLRMVSQSTTVGLTLAGAMTPIGMSGVVQMLIRRGFVDFIISTGANLYHDMHRPFDGPMMQGCHTADDNELADQGIARIYDVFIEDTDTLMATDKAILRALKGFAPEESFSTADLHYMLGKYVLENAPHPEKSLLATATEHEVPVFTPSPGDSSIGMNLIVPHMYERPVNLNPLLDVIETAAIVRAAETNGVVIIGGGSPKNFYLQTQPTLWQILHDESKGGHDYMIQLTTDSPHWGGLSGATPQEARSWGKIKDAKKDNVVVYSCASLTFPLLAQYVLDRQSADRPLKRLYPKLKELSREMKEAAADKVASDITEVNRL